MAFAHWKKPENEPDEYGMYLVTTCIDSDESETAYYGHPNGERRTGWFQLLNGRLVQTDIIAWDHMPAPYKAT